MCRRKSRKFGFGSGKASNQFTNSLFEGLFGDVAALIERIGEAVVKARQTRNLLPKEIL
jgi:hypothetical protein